MPAPDLPRLVCICAVLASVKLSASSPTPSTFIEVAGEPASGPETTHLVCVFRRMHFRKEPENSRPPSANANYTSSTSRWNSSRESLRLKKLPAQMRSSTPTSSRARRKPGPQARRSRQFASKSWGRSAVSEETLGQIGVLGLRWQHAQSDQHIASSDASPASAASSKLKSPLGCAQESLMAKKASPCPSHHEKPCPRRGFEKMSR